MQICEFCKNTVLSGMVQWFIRDMESPEKLLQVCRECFRIAGISNSVQSKAPLIERPPKYERIVYRKRKPLQIKMEGIEFMKPVSNEDIKNLERDYRHFCALGHSELKSLWLAMSGRGYVDIVRSSKDTIQVMRRTDKKYVVCSYPLMETMTIKAEKQIRVVRFHTDDSKLEIQKLTI